MSGLPEILKQKSVFRPRDYFISLRRAPVLEHLVKANLYKLSQEVMNYPEKYPVHNNTVRYILDLGSAETL